MVRHAPLAFVGLTLKATARDLTVPMQVIRLVAPVWIGMLVVKATMLGIAGPWHAGLRELVECVRVCLPEADRVSPLCIGLRLGRLRCMRPPSMPRLST